MKNPIALLIIVLIAAFSVSTIQAQNKDFKPKKTPEERAQKITDKLNEKLSLSSDQYSKIYIIFLSHAQQADQIRSSSDKQSRKDQMKSLRQSTDSQVQSVLSSEQLQKYNEIKKMIMEKRKLKREKKNSKQKNQ